MTNHKRGYIDLNLCKKCKDCPPKNDCPVKAIEEEEGLPYVSPLCTGCGQCLVKCPNWAISLI